MWCFHECDVHYMFSIRFLASWMPACFSTHIKLLGSVGIWGTIVLEKIGYCLYIMGSWCIFIDSISVSMLLFSHCHGQEFLYPVLGSAVSSIVSLFKFICLLFLWSSVGRIQNRVVMLVVFCSQAYLCLFVMPQWTEFGTLLAVLEADYF